MARKTRIKRHGGRSVLLWGLVLAAFLSELLFYTWCRVQYTRTGYEISKELKHQRHLAGQQQQLQIELARLKTPSRIARIAWEKLNLVMPQAQQTVYLP